MSTSHSIPKIPWTPADDDYLTTHYHPDRPGQIATLAHQLARTTHAVKRRAGLLGLRKPRAQRPWTAEEESFLQNHSGSLLQPVLAKRLKRSVSSVSQKCKQLDLRTRFREGYTLQDLVACFGQSSHTIQGWVHDGKLVIQRRGTHRPHDAWCVTEHAILTFIEHHPFAFDLHKVEPLWFLDLLFDGRILQRALQQAHQISTTAG